MAHDEAYNELVESASNVAVVPLGHLHWPQVHAIYEAGIATGHATFEAHPPSWGHLERSCLPDQRLVALAITGEVVGWAAASSVSDRCVYSGVVEHSVYVAATSQDQGIGTALLRQLIRSTEEAGIWTLQCGIFPENNASLRLHQAVGFRVVGTRERLGHMTYGPLKGTWRDVLMLEHRSNLAGT